MSEGRPYHTTVVSRASDEEPQAGAREALEGLERLVNTARGRLRDRVIDVGGARPAATDGFVGVSLTVTPRVSAFLVEQRQTAADALAHLATEVEAARFVLAWAEHRSGRLDRRIAEAFIAEAHRQAHHGVALAPGETVALAELDLSEEEIAAALGTGALDAWSRAAVSSDGLQNVAESAVDAGIALPIGRADDEGATAARSTFRALAVQAAANGTLCGAFECLGDACAFGLARSEDNGGGGQGAIEQAIALEEIGRGAPALATAAADAVITAALLEAHGTPAQQRAWLYRVNQGRAVPAILVRELGVLQTAFTRARAEPWDDGGYALFGDKAGPPHAKDADLFLVLARIDPGLTGVEGLGFLLAPRPEEGEPARLAVSDDGGVSFDELVPDRAAGGAEGPPLTGLLGGQQGLAAKSLATVLEVGWLADAAILLGIAQAGLEMATLAARERLHGSPPLSRRPRVGARLGRLVVLTTTARRLVLAAASALDDGAGPIPSAMARLITARAAGAALGLAREIHVAVSRPVPPVLAAFDAAFAAVRVARGTDDDVAAVLALRLLA